MNLFQKFVILCQLLLVEGLTYHHSYFGAEEEPSKDSTFLRPPDHRGADLDGPRWIVEPPNEAAFSNSTGLRLECVARGKNVEIRWYQRDILITTDVSGLRFVSDNGTLTFFPFRSDDYREDVHHGIYHCRAENKYGVIISRNVKIQAVVDEEYTISVRDSYVIRGNTAVLRCEIPSYVLDYVRVTSWIHEEGTAIEIFPEKDPRGKYTLLQSGDLLVHHTSTYDTYKKYICKTEHKLTGVRKRSSKEARIILTDPKGTVIPQVLEPRSQRLEKRHWMGENILLPCVSQGYPVPESTWFKTEATGLRQVIPSSRFQYHLEVLIIHQLSVGDRGVYVCITNNTSGTRRVEVDLSVYSPLESRISPMQQIVDLNRPAEFRCTTSGSPVTSVKWLKNGESIEENPRYNLENNSTLRIHSVQEGDEGQFQCVIQNDMDFAQATGSLQLGDALPVLLYKFSEQTLQPGPTVSLKCVGKGNPPPRIKWLLDDFPIPQNQRYMMGQYVTIHDDVISHVNISGVISSDGGLYSCVAENSVGSVKHDARLNIYGPPKIRPIPIVKAIQGKDIWISCPVSGYPIQSILWQRDGYKLPSNGRQSVYDNGTLAIREARKLEDEGYYTCSAFNQRDDSHTGTIQIQVLSPPTIMPFLFPNKLLSEGMRSAVSCQILEGNLPIGFSWIRNGRRIGEGSYELDKGITIRSNDQYSSTLVIEELQFRHRGNYTCVASNSAGSASYTTVLSVNVAPKWVRIPENLHAVDGQEIYIDCEVEGYPKPELTWSRANAVSDFSDKPSLSTSEYHKLPNGTLYIASAEKASEGIYTCSAENGVRSGVSKSINITVNSPPRFLEEKVHLSVRKGEKGILICEVAGDENIDILWRRNGMPISEKEDARFDIENHYTLYGSVSRFVISPILDQDSGPVTCEAVNQYGRDQKNFILSVEDIPSAPRGVRITNVESRSLEIGWETPHDGNSHILNYLVEYSNLPDERDQGEKQRRKMTAPGDAISLVIQNLRPGTKYKFNVLAENRHGISPESHAVIIRTQEEAPSGSPRNVEVVAKSSVELRVTWLAPQISNWNSELLSYKIGYKEVGRTSGLQFVYRQSSSHLSESMILSSLKKFSSYQIIIWPYNKEGIGPSSNTIVATTMEDVPSGPPQDVRCDSQSSSSLEIMWSKPRSEERNGIIRGYLVQHYPVAIYYDTEGALQSKETDSDIIRLNGLKKYSNYSINVFAFTRAGVAKKGASVFCQTKEDVPSSPEDIKAVVSGSESVIVSWRSPKYPNGIIQKYTIYRREMVRGNEIDLKENNVLSGPNYIELGNLEYNRRYDIWVKAETSAGYGPPSDVTSVILGHTIQARIVSFGETVVIPWKKTLVLDCLNVGDPIPSIEWKHGRSSIQENSKYQIYPNGSLSVHLIDERDEDDYRCVVQNIHGSDEIIYDLVVQVPPDAPVLTLKNITHTSAELHWRSSPSRKKPIMSFTLYYRREHGKWQISRANPFKDRSWINDLYCGSNYTFYVSAHNHVGTSLPSTVISAKTTGSVPDIAKKVISSNITMVQVDLTAFYDGGCPILYFVLEYKRDTQNKYTMVSNNVSPLDEKYIIRGLDPGTRYYIRITAHNSAGSSISEFAFSTLTSLGSELPPPAKDSRESQSKVWAWILRTMAVLVLFSGVAAATFYGSFILRKWRIKRNDDEDDECHHTLNRRHNYPKSPIFENRHYFLPPQPTTPAPNLAQFVRKVPVIDHGGGVGNGQMSLVCSASGVANGGHAIGQVFQPCSTTKTVETWLDPEMYPFATFSSQPGNPQQVTINLQHHNPHQRICNFGNVFAASTPAVIDPNIMTTTTCPLTGTEVVTINGFETIVDPIYSKINCRSEEFLSRQTPGSTPPVRSESLLHPEARHDSDSDVDYRPKPQRPPNRGKLKRRAQIINAQRYSSSSSDNETPIQSRSRTTISEH